MSQEHTPVAAALDLQANTGTTGTYIATTKVTAPTENGMHENVHSGSPGESQDNEIQDVVEERGMTFQKRLVPKQRTQSVQSVLSSVSLKSFVNQNRQSLGPAQQVQQAQLSHQLSGSQISQQSNAHLNHSQSTSQFIHTKTHIQAPAAAASSKRRASFEIGQRLPFSKELSAPLSQDDAQTAVATSSDDGREAAEAMEQNRKLTDAALRKLSALSRFQPAEVDMSMRTTTAVDDHSPEPPLVSMPHVLLSRTSSHINVQPQARRVVSQSRLMSPQSDRSTAATPPGEELQQTQRAQQLSAKLLSQTTSTQDLHSFQPSPVSFQDNANLKTISDPKRPMYIPAVLRQSNTNLKPEDVKHINEQKSRRSKSVLSDAANSLRSQTSHWSLRFDNYNTNTSLPTRAHWRRDTSRRSCSFCEKEFTFFERRHHCRRCGDIFCAQHTQGLLKLGADAQFTTGGAGMLCKVCDNCMDDYRAFYKLQFGDSGAGNNAEQQMRRKSGATVSDSKQQENGQGAVAGTVPADWTWSSF